MIESAGHLTEIAQEVRRGRAAGWNVPRFGALRKAAATFNAVRISGLALVGLAATLASTMGAPSVQDLTDPTSPKAKDVFVRSPESEGGLVQVPGNVDHRPFDELLKRYVDERGLVNYAAWKKSDADMTALRQYTEQFSRGETFDSGAERAASLINAYNAFTLRWVLESYPVPSIWETKDPFKAKRHLIGGQTVSLDDIEKQTLVPLIGYRVHAAVVCAARSCPPLRQEAYRGDILDKQLDEAFRFWLARSDLNRFDAQKRQAKISSVFKWYKQDFGGEDGIIAVLAKYAPADARTFLRSGKVDVEYLPYHWGLNDQSDLGRDYKRGFLKKLFQAI